MRGEKESLLQFYIVIPFVLTIVVLCLVCNLNDTVQLEQDCCMTRMYRRILCNSWAEEMIQDLEGGAPKQYLQTCVQLHNICISYPLWRQLQRNFI